MMLKTITKSILVLLAVALVMQAATAIGVSPSRVDAEHMSRGSHFEKTVYLSGATQDARISIEKEGEISTWVSTDKSTGFIFPKGQQQVPVRISIDVPDDAANGQYYAYLKISSIPQGEPGLSNTVSVIPGVRIMIKVDVTGEQVTDYRIASISIVSSEQDSPLPIAIDIENNGNVMAIPKLLQLHVLDKSRTQDVYSANITGIEGTEPHTRQTKTVLVENNLGPGEYWALIKIYDESGVIFSDERPFAVSEKGSLRKSGIFRILETPMPTITGNTVKLVGWFENTGDVDLDAKMTGEIYDGKKMITVAESDAINVPPSGIVPLTLYYKPKAPGRYSVIGYVTYSGRQSSEKNATLLVMQNKSSVSAQTKTVIILVILAAAIACVLLIAIIRRQK